MICPSKQWHCFCNNRVRIWCEEHIFLPLEISYLKYQQPCPCLLMEIPWNDNYEAKMCKNVPMCMYSSVCLNVCTKVCSKALKTVPKWMCKVAANVRALVQSRGSESGDRRGCLWTPPVLLRILCAACSHVSAVVHTVRVRVLVYMCNCTHAIHYLVHITGIQFSRWRVDGMNINWCITKACNHFPKSAYAMKSHCVIPQMSTS